jgi:murein DD-endopeptidase MepM/ murein hydrolase activator NlpD
MHTYPHSPFRTGGVITTEFSKAHKAKDIAPRNDDEGQVFAIEAGTVTDTEYGMAPGEDHANMVIVRGVDQFLTVYAHVAPSVAPGTMVKKDEKIGIVDLSGHSSGRHVHLARLPGGDGTVDDVLDLDRQDEAVNYLIASMKPW